MFSPEAFALFNAQDKEEVERRQRLRREEMVMDLRVLLQRMEAEKKVLLDRLHHVQEENLYGSSRAPVASVCEWISF